MATATLSQFTKYLGAPPAWSERVGREIARQIDRPYNPGADYWRDLRNALLTDRRGTRDGQALAAKAASVSDVRKRAPFTAAARNWAQLTTCWDGLAYEPVAGTTVQIGDLSVKLPRLLGERHPDGELEVLIVQLTKGKLLPHVVDRVLRVVERAHPEAVVTYVDVERAAVYTSRGRDLTVYDAWLDVAGSDLARILDDGQEQAQAA